VAWSLSELRHGVTKLQTARPEKINTTRSVSSILLEWGEWEVEAQRNSQYANFSEISIHYRSTLIALVRSGA